MARAMTRREDIGAAAATAIVPREQQVGFEIGLNFEEMLDALDVHHDTWWGIATHVVADGFRIPFTNGGFRYDLNHHEWRGTDSGDSCGECP